MQQLDHNPVLNDVTMTALAKLLLKKAAELPETTGPESIGRIAPRAAAEIVKRAKTGSTSGE